MTSTHTIETRGDIGVNITSFLRHLRAGNLSPGTVTSYAESVQQLAAFLACRRMPQDVAAIRREHVETFILDQLERWRPATANNRPRPTTGTVASSSASSSCSKLARSGPRR